MDTITYNPQMPLISIHIPKSGGVSFREILAQWFRPGFYTHYFDGKNNKRPGKVQIHDTPAQAKSNVSICIHGHFNKSRQVGVFDYYPSANQFITIMRDPVETHISNYFYVKKRLRENKHFRNGVKQEFKWSCIDEYFENTNSFILFHFPWEFSLENFKEILLTNFVHIGVMEKYQQSVDIMARKLGKTPMSIPQKNVSPRDEIPSTDVIEKWKKRHLLEISIYQFARELNTTGDC